MTSEERVVAKSTDVHINVHICSKIACNLKDNILNEHIQCNYLYSFVTLCIIGLNDKSTHHPFRQLLPLPPMPFLSLVSLCTSRF